MYDFMYLYYIIYLLVILAIDITGNYLFDSLNYKINKILHSKG